MNPKKLIEAHKLPCGPMSVAVDGVCRRRLKDHFDSLLDRLTQETHPAGVDEEILEMEEQVELPEEPEHQETDEEKREKMLSDGKMKIDVKRELAKYEAETSEEPEEEEEEEETEDEMKKRLIKEGKLRADVKKVVQNYEDKIMPKPKNTSQGNSKMLQDRTGKINKR